MLHIYIFWYYEVTVDFQPKISFIYRVNPVLYPNILTQVYNNYNINVYISDVPTTDWPN